MKYFWVKLYYKNQNYLLLNFAISFKSYPHLICGFVGSRCVGMNKPVNKKMLLYLNGTQRLMNQ